MESGPARLFIGAEGFGSSLRNHNAEAQDDAAAKHHLFSLMARQGSGSTCLMAFTQGILLGIGGECYRSSNLRKYWQKCYA